MQNPGTAMSEVVVYKGVYSNTFVINPNGCLREITIVLSLGS